MSSSNGVLGEDLISLRNASQLLPQRLVFGCENVEAGDLYLALWVWVMFSLALWINLWIRVPPVILFLYDMVEWVKTVGAMVLGKISHPPDMAFTRSDPYRSPYYNIDRE